MAFPWLTQNNALKNFVKSNIYMMRIAHYLIVYFDLFLPLERDFEIVGFLPRSEFQIILDVGAHKGESVRSFRLFDKESNIFSIEANPANEKYLKRLKEKIVNFNFQILFASSNCQGAKLFIPSYKGQELTCWSSSNMDAAFKIFEERSCLKELDSCLDFKSIEGASIALDELNLDPFLIKIDVEGGEANIIEGLTRTIAKTYPVLMIENNDTQAVADLLEPFSYQAYIYNGVKQIFEKYNGQDNLNLIYISINNKKYNELLRYIEK